jgi:hypothetical protein
VADDSKVDFGADAVLVAAFVCLGFVERYSSNIVEGIYD